MNNRILAVEDSPTQREMLRGELAEAGFEVTVAASGQDALDCLDNGSFDLVVSDVVMPGIDGYQLCSMIKERDRDLPVVLLTSLTDPTEIVRGLEAGADNFLRKPYEPAQLVSRLRGILYHREQRGGGQAGMGLEVVLRNQRFMITAERQQILDLLVSSFEDLVLANDQLRDREQALTLTQRDLHTQLTALERERQRVVGVLAAVPHAMVIVNAEGVITDASERYLARFGPIEHGAVGRPVQSAHTLLDASGAEIPWEARPICRALRHGEPVELGASFDLFATAADGSVIPVIATAAPLRNASGNVVGAVGALHEIGSLAAHDPLTKLPNHALFTDRVQQAVTISDPAGRSVGVLAVRLDRLARLRQSLAPTAADRVVAEAAARVQHLVADEAIQQAAPGASVAYFGDDLFAVVLPSLADDVEAVRLARVLAEGFGGDVDAGDVTVPLSVSVGVAVSTGGEGAVALVTAAAAAARRADAHQVEAVDPAVDARAGDELRREVELRLAIERGELEVHYQPQIAVRGSGTIGFEALVRWRHPDHGLLPPAQFIPLAEETGLIAPLGWWVLREACRQAAEWRTRLPGGEHLVMSVNFAARQLADPDATVRVQSALAETGLDPAALMLEITESGVMVDASTAVERLRALKALGVRLAIDDFGTGYSSLLQLRRFPVDALKIDRTFVAGMTVEPADAAIVAGTVRLAQALGLDAVAEGVETFEQLAQLRVLGCEQAQGYYWSRPVAPGELERWWHEHGRPEIDGGGQDERPAGQDPGEERLDDALAYLVHELRQPLGVILGAADLAADAAPQDRVRHLDTVVRNTRELDRRLALLSEARDARGGIVRLEVQQCDIGGLVSALVADLGGQLAPHPVAVSTAAGVAASVDPARLRQAMTNLLTNAAKFSPREAPIEITVERAGSFVEVSVRDHGSGIPAERRPELFRRFSRLGSHTPGMGIGLYLADVIARAHGGQVRYEAVADGGSRFVLSILDEERAVSQTRGGVGAPATSGS